MKIEKAKKKHYVNNPDFYQALLNYRGRNNPDDRVPKYIGECIAEICRRLSTKPNFIGYTYREDMVGDAIEIVLGLLMASILLNQKTLLHILLKLLGMLC